MNHTCLCLPHLPTPEGRKAELALALEQPKNRFKDRTVTKAEEDGGSSKTQSWMEKNHLQPMLYYQQQGKSQSVRMLYN